MDDAEHCADPQEQTRSARRKLLEDRTAALQTAGPQLKLPAELRTTSSSSLVSGSERCCLKAQTARQNEDNLPLNQ